MVLSGAMFRPCVMDLYLFLRLVPGSIINSQNKSAARNTDSPSRRNKMEDRAIERLTDLNDFWMPYVDSTVTYPVDCVYTEEELDTIDMYKTDFENTVAEQEGLWLKEGGPTDEEWDAYVAKLKDTCGMEELLGVYQTAYDRYVEDAK